jgi:hypothetical protein
MYLKTFVVLLKELSLLSHTQTTCLSRLQPLLRWFQKLGNYSQQISQRTYSTCYWQRLAFVIIIRCLIIQVLPCYYICLDLSGSIIYTCTVVVGMHVQWCTLPSISRAGSSLIMREILIHTEFNVPVISHLFTVRVVGIIALVLSDRCEGSVLDSRVPFAMRFKDIKDSS